MSSDIAIGVAVAIAILALCLGVSTIIYFATDANDCHRMCGSAGVKTFSLTAAEHKGVTTPICECK
jgi:hypothetical protein